jgi:phage gp45-like
MADPLGHLRHHLRPIVTRIANSISRAALHLVDDTAKLQRVQVVVLADSEPLDAAEHFQPYGYTSVPLSGAEAVVLCPNGDPGHPLVVAVSDRRYRPTGAAPGEVTVYNHTGAKAIFKANGDIEIQPAAGREVFVRSEGGTVDRLVKKSEHDGHTHLPGSFTAPGGGGPVTGVSAGAAPVTGTLKLRVE